MRSLLVLTILGILSGGAFAERTARRSSALVDHVIAKNTPHHQLPAFVSWIDSAGKRHQRHGTVHELAGIPRTTSGERLVQFEKGVPGTRWVPLFGGDY